MRAVKNFLRTAVVMASLSGSLVGFSELLAPVLSAAESPTQPDQSTASTPESSSGSRNMREERGDHPMRKACAEDIKKLCSDVKAGQGRIVQCLKRHAHELSQGCADMMQQRGQHRQ
jgi:hypothetical protein